MFLVHVLLEIETMLITNFDMADVKCVNDSLDGFGLVSWCRSKCENTEVRIFSHEETNNLRICIVAAAFVSLILMAVFSIVSICDATKRERTDDKQDYVARITIVGS